MSERLGHNPNRISLKEKEDCVQTLMRREQETWGLKDIPPPPDGLFEVLNKAHEKGYTTLKPHYFPERKFTENSEWPGRKIKPGKWYWDFIRNGQLPKVSSRLQDMWFLFDTIQIGQNQQDGLGLLIRQLRIEGKISPIKDNYAINPLLKPENQPMMKSRFHISWDQINNSVNPVIADMLQIHSPNIVRLPRFIEINLLENIHSSLFHPLPWRNEWLQETVKKIDKDGTLVDQGDRLMVGYHWDRFDIQKHNVQTYFNYFRPMITFPIQK